MISNEDHQQGSNNEYAHAHRELEEWRNRAKPVFRGLTILLRSGVLQLNRSNERLIKIRGMYDRPPFNGRHRFKFSLLKGFVDLVRHELELSTIPSLVTFRSVIIKDAVEIDEEVIIPEDEFAYDPLFVFMDWLNLAEDELIPMQDALSQGLEELSTSTLTLNRIANDLRGLPTTHENDQMMQVIHQSQLSLDTLANDLQQLLKDCESFGSFISQMQQD